MRGFIEMIAIHTNPKRKRGDDFTFLVFLRFGLVIVLPVHVATPRTVGTAAPNIILAEVHACPRNIRLAVSEPSLGRFLAGRP